MFRCRLFSYLVLLLLLPSLLIYPLGNSKAPIPESGAKKEYASLTYDGVLQLLEEIESGELERKCSPDQLWKINRFVALLAYEGMPSNDASAGIALNQDIFSLLYDESPFYYAFSSNRSGDFYFAQTLSYDTLRKNIQQCGWVSKNWKSTKKFVKKHKTAIIVGAVVVVAATVVIVAVSASSSAAAAAAGAAGTAAASDSKPKEPSPLLEKDESPSECLERSEELLVQEVINEKASSVKEVVYEDVASKQDPQSLAEKGRELGAHLAHEAFDAVAEYLKLGPEAIEEIKEFGSKLLPEDLSCENNELMGNAVENYEKTIEKGHKAIDKAFHTDQAELYAKDAKQNKLSDMFTVGFIPIPGMLSKKGAINVKAFSKLGRVPDRAGFTKAGRGSMKHGYRSETVFEKPVGNPNQINEHGQKTLDRILNHPNKVIKQYTSNNYGPVIEIWTPEQGGVRFTGDGKEMIGFLQPKSYKK